MDTAITDEGISMRMGWLILALSIGSLSGCSCQQSPEPATEDTVSAAAAHGDMPHPADTAMPSPEETAAKARHRQALADAADIVQRYLNALAMRDQAQAGGFWSGGQLPPRPDDAALRTVLQEMQSIKIMSDAPVALDEHSPPRTVEVPVRLRIQTPTGLQRIQGTYRLHAKSETGADRTQWEIVSASIQPELR